MKATETAISWEFFNKAFPKINPDLNGIKFKHRVNLIISFNLLANGRRATKIKQKPEGHDKKTRAVDL